MNTDGYRGSEGPGRSGALAAGGLVLAGGGELCSVGLLGLSGWFITACAIAGAAVISSFSYLAPSGGVRALALGRIVGNYSKRLVLHAAALHDVARTRADFFHRVACHRPGRPAGVWSGELLDRSMADADRAGMALIGSTAPAVVAAVVTAAGVLAVVLAGSVVSATVLAVGVLLTAAVSYLGRDPASPDEQHTRNALRAELVTAVDAWPEMASLGAADQLAARTARSLARLDAAHHTGDRRRLRRELLVGLVGVSTLAGTAATALGDVDSAAGWVLIALVTAGLLTSAAQLPAAAEARSTAAAARGRLTGRSPADAPAGLDDLRMRPCVTTTEIGFDEYPLPGIALRPPRMLGARVPVGGTLVVTGRSGSGKSTLLRALASSLRGSLQPSDGRPAVTAVTAEDYLFTGTLGSNFRLADPSLTDRDVDDHLAALWLDRSGLTAATPVGPGGRALSGGERRRVSLGRALATQPHVLVVDEPTTGLDQRSAEHILRILEELPDVTLVLAVHTLPQALEPRDVVSVSLG